MSSSLISSQSGMLDGLEDPATAEGGKAYANSSSRGSHGGRASSWAAPPHPAIPSDPLTTVLGDLLADEDEVRAQTGRDRGRFHAGRGAAGR